LNRAPILTATGSTGHPPSRRRLRVPRRALRGWTPGHVRAAPVRVPAWAPVRVPARAPVG